MCAAGQKFVNVQPDGSVFRCGIKPANYLGNILRGDVHFLNEKAPCISKYCVYFCEKYSDPRVAERRPPMIADVPATRPGAFNDTAAAAQATLSQVGWPSG